MTIKDNPGQIGKIGTTLGEMNANITNIKMENLNDDKLFVYLNLKTPLKYEMSDIIMVLLKLDGILNVEYENKDYASN